MTTIEERVRASAANDAERKAKKLSRKSTPSTNIGAVAVPDGVDES